MGWIASLARVVGAAVPFGSVAVQISAELESREVQQRLQKIEDPISALHPDVRSVSKLIYERLRAANGSKIHLSESEQDEYARPLAVIEAEGLLDGTHAIGTHYSIGYWLRNPTYVLYMAALYEDAALMERLVERVDLAKRGNWLNGMELAAELGLPVRTVQAVLELYTRKGLGLMSREIGTVNYMARA
jgi:hypothetical protein